MKVTIKSILTDLIFPCCFLCLRVVRLLRLRPRERVLVFPSADPGSLGDEGMLLAVVDRVARTSNRSELTIAFYGNLPSWKEWANSHRLQQIGFVKSPSLLGLHRLAGQMLSCKQVFCIGADTIDGKYGPEFQVHRFFLLHLCSLAGADVRIVGSSFNKEPSPDCVSALRKLPLNVVICAREAVSQERLRSTLNRPIKLVADAAFLVEPQVVRDSVSALLKWIVEQRRQGCRVIGVNANDTLIPHSISMTLEELAPKYHALVQESLDVDPTLRFVFLGHDTREYLGRDRRGRNEFVFADVICREMPASLRDSCHSQSEACSYPEIKAICSNLDLIITGKMHLAIAGLSMGTPVGCIVYQDKFEGLIEGHFGLNDVCVTASEAYSPRGLRLLVERLVPRLPELRTQIQHRLPAVIDLSKKNFE